ncbi:MAG: PIN domain-containing protein [Chloroflexi bacterium]|nr:PIN domain-containing protein [Chloroflexota bacterium]
MPMAITVEKLAVTAGCGYMVTYNVADFEGVEVFGLKVVTSREFLQVIGELP